MRTFIFAAVTALVMPAALAAQSAPAAADACPNGEVARMRVSKIKPEGSMAGFMEAAAEHAVWYRSHGFRIEQTVAPVLTYPGGVPTVSTDEVMTLATGDDVPRDRRDPAWNAYVAKYRANSDLLIKKVVCMPRRG